MEKRRSQEKGLGDERKQGQENRRIVKTTGIISEKEIGTETQKITVKRVNRKTKVGEEVSKRDQRLIEEKEEVSTSRASEAAAIEEIAKRKINATKKRRKGSQNEIT